MYRLKQEMSHNAATSYSTKTQGIVLYSTAFAASNSMARSHGDAHKRLNWAKFTNEIAENLRTAIVTAMDRDDS
jgi:uracil DNA glycosylase